MEASCIVQPKSILAMSGYLKDSNTSTVYFISITAVVSLGAIALVIILPDLHWEKNIEKTITQTKKNTFIKYNLYPSVAKSACRSFSIIQFLYQYQFSFFNFCYNHLCNSIIVINSKWLVTQVDE